MEQNTTNNTSALPIMFDAFATVRRILALVLVALLAFGALAPAAVSADTDHLVPTLDTITSGAPARYAPISPVRVVDTRVGRGASALSPGQTARVQLITPTVRAAAGSDSPSQPLGLQSTPLTNGFIRYRDHRHSASKVAEIHLATPQMNTATNTATNTSNSTNGHRQQHRFEHPASGHFERPRDNRSSRCCDR